MTKKPGEWINTRVRGGATPGATGNQNAIAAALAIQRFELTRFDLDKVTPNNPVRITNIFFSPTGDSFVNTKALQPIIDRYGADLPGRPRRQIGNQVYALACCLAHNLSRHLQMAVNPPVRRQTLTRACLWVFERVATFRNRIVRLAGRLTRPGGQLTLTLATNNAAQNDFARYLDVLDRRAA